MEYKVKLKCNSCDYEETFNLGQCNSDGSIEKVLPLLNDENREYIKRIMVKDNLISFTFYRKLGYCEKCKKISAINIINLFTKDGNVVQLRDNCPICNNKVLIFDLESNIDVNLTCIKCAKAKLDIKRIDSLD